MADGFLGIPKDFNEVADSQPISTYKAIWFKKEQLPTSPDAVELTQSELDLPLSSSATFPSLAIWIVGSCDPNNDTKARALKRLLSRNSKPPNQRQTEQTDARSERFSEALFEASKGICCLTGGRGSTQAAHIIGRAMGSPILEIVCTAIGNATTSFFRSYGETDYGARVFADARVDPPFTGSDCDINAPVNGRTLTSDLHDAGDRGRKWVSDPVNKTLIWLDDDQILDQRMILNFGYLSSQALTHPLPPIIDNPNGTFKSTDEQFVLLCLEVLSVFSHRFMTEKKKAQVHELATLCVTTMDDDDKDGKPRDQQLGGSEGAGNPGESKIRSGSDEPPQKKARLEFNDTSTIVDTHAIVGTLFDEVISSTSLKDRDDEKDRLIEQALRERYPQVWNRTRAEVFLYHEAVVDAARLMLHTSASIAAHTVEEN